MSAVAEGVEVVEGGAAAGKHLEKGAVWKKSESKVVFQYGVDESR